MTTLRVFVMPDGGDPGSLPLGDISDTSHVGVASLGANGKLPFAQASMVTVADYGAVPNTGTDQGPAIQAAITDLSQMVGTPFAKALYFPLGTYLTNQALTTNAPLAICGPSRLGTVIGIGPSFPSGGTLLSFVKDVSSPVTLEGKVPGLSLKGLTLSGAERTIQASALRLDYFDRAQIDIYVASFRGTVLKARDMRESNIAIRSWLCGDGATYPVLDFDETGSAITEGSNLNQFVGSVFVLNMGDHLRARAPSGVVIGQNFFTNCVFHGLNEWIGDEYADEFGYFDPDPNGDGNFPCRFVIDNAQNFMFDQCRLHLNGRGQPLFWLSNLTAGAATLNQVKLSGTVLSYRGNRYSARGLRSADPATDQLQAAGIQVPGGGAYVNPHQMTTGSRVQFTGAALPGGLVAATDYFAIRVDATNFKVATSRANALAGTAVDITDTVATGTLTQFDTYCTVNATTDTLTAASHRLTTGARFQVSATSLPGGLSAATDYFVIRVDKDTIKLATTTANAAAGTAIDLTSTGTDVVIAPQDFIAHVESGSFVWASGNIVSGVAPTRGYFRVEDVAGSNPIGTVTYGLGTVWSAGGTNPVAEYASGALPGTKLDTNLFLNRNNHPVYGTRTDGVAIQMMRYNASNTADFGSLSGSDNARFIAAGIATILGGGQERFRASSVGLSFNGATAVAKPTITGSRASGAALADLLTKLATLGLITDGTSA